ncbi:hypothetical protein ABTA67_19795, partial [Acinetobacter baumannii]
PVQGNANNGRILVYKVGGKGQLTPPPAVKLAFPKPPVPSTDAKLLAAGHVTYNRYCLVCHGYDAISGGVTPDLRRSPLIADPAGFKDVVMNG